MLLVLLCLEPRYRATYAGLTKNQGWRIIGPLNRSGRAKPRLEEYSLFLE
jgi:hypothetical protein